MRTRVYVRVACAYTVTTKPPWVRRGPVDRTTAPPIGRRSAAVRVRINAAAEDRSRRPCSRDRRNGIVTNDGRRSVRYLYIFFYFSHSYCSCLGALLRYTTSPSVSDGVRMIIYNIRIYITPLLVQCTFFRSLSKYRPITRSFVRPDICRVNAIMCHDKLVRGVTQVARLLRPLCRGDGNSDVRSRRHEIKRRPDRAAEIVDCRRAVIYAGSVSPTNGRGFLISVRSDGIDAGRCAEATCGVLARRARNTFNDDDNDTLMRRGRTVA